MILMINLIKNHLISIIAVILKKSFQLRVKNSNLSDNVKILRAKYQLSRNSTDIDQIIEELISLHIIDQDKVII